MKSGVVICRYEADLGAEALDHSQGFMNLVSRTPRTPMPLRPSWDHPAMDRAAFGGTLMGLGVLCTWLTVFLLSRGEQWAW